MMNRQGVVDLVDKAGWIVARKTLSRVRLYVA